jgi:hypothetical protein
MLPSERLIKACIKKGHFTFKELGLILDAVDFIHYMKVRA